WIAQARWTTASAPSNAPARARSASGCPRSTGRHSTPPSDSAGGRRHRPTMSVAGSCARSPRINAVPRLPQAPVIAIRTRSVPADGALELGLRHRGPSVDVLLTSFVVELRLRPPTGAAVRAQSAAPARGDVVRRGAAGLARLPRPRALLVHRPGRDLLG